MVGYLGQIDNIHIHILLEMVFTHLTNRYKQLIKGLV